MLNYCTYFDKNYLGQGLALYKSLDTHCLPFHLWILALCDDALRCLKRLNLVNVTIISMKEFETPELLRVRPTRTWQEYIWTCTGSLILHVLSHYSNVDHINYIDSDCFFFGNSLPVFIEIGDASIGITPHRSSPPWRPWASKNGIYNVGLVYAKKSREGVACIKHYAKQCIEWCYYRYEDGKFCDQKYLDDWPKHWGAHSIRHKGANLAPWNQADQYKYSLRGGTIYVDEDPLIWYHFHQGVKPGKPYILDPFVDKYIYGFYRHILAKAQQEIKLCCE